jgi:hypothetical protein
MAFAEKATLTIHITSAHSKDKPFACRDCPLRFANRSNLRSHERKHAPPEEQLSCLFPGCPFRCASYSGRTSHMSKMHADAAPPSVAPTMASKRLVAENVSKRDPKRVRMSTASFQLQNFPSMDASPSHLLLTIPHQAGGAPDPPIALPLPAALPPCLSPGLPPALPPNSSVSLVGPSILLLH